MRGENNYNPQSMLRNSYGYQPVSESRNFQNNGRGQNRPIERTYQQPQRNISNLIKNLESKIQGVQSLAHQKKFGGLNSSEQNGCQQYSYERKQSNQAIRDIKKPFVGLPEQMRGMDLRGSCPNVYKRENLRNTVAITAQSPIFDMIRQENGHKSPFKQSVRELYRNNMLSKNSNNLDNFQFEKSPLKNNPFVPYNMQKKSAESNSNHTTVSKASNNTEFTEFSSKSQVQQSKSKLQGINSQFTSLSDILAKKEQLKQMLTQKKQQIQAHSQVNIPNKVIGEPKNKIVHGFELGKVLGKGKFGQVFLAKHISTGFIVAIKKIVKSKVIQYKMLDQLKNQIRIHSALNHPNIVKFFGMLQENDEIYLIIEYLNGGTLFDFLNEKENLSIKEAVDFLRDTISAVQYLHERSIAHRDIKPQNIVLSSQGVAKLCDFGWSALVESSRKTYCGTFDYAPPQILQRKNYDESVDIWCIGVLTYELLTGRVPFQGEKRNVIMQKIINVDKNRMEFPQSMNEDAKHFIESLVKKDPDERPKSKDLLKFPFFVNNPPATQKKKSLI